MTKEQIRDWMKAFGVSIHKLAPFIGVTAAYFNHVLTSSDPISKALQKKLTDVMKLDDVSVIKDMAYLKVPFTRAEWKQVKAMFPDDDELARMLKKRVLACVKNANDELEKI